MNSRGKGKRGEREFAALLSEHGFQARRGQQFSGGADSPNVVSEELAWLHVELKRVQNLNLTDACVQAECDQARPGLNGKRKLAWIVAHRRNHAPWLITMRAETFFQLLRGELPPVAAPLANRMDGTEGTDSTPHPSPMTHSRPLVRPDGPSTSRIPPSASQAAGVPDRGGEGD